MLSLSLLLPLSTKMSHTNDMLLVPEELHLGSFQLGQSWLLDEAFYGS